MTEESLIEWAMHWIPDAALRDRFAEGLKSELASLKRRVFEDGYDFGVEYTGDEVDKTVEDAWRAYTSTAEHKGTEDPK